MDFELVFFHARKDWLRKTLPSGQKRVVSGKLEIFDGVAQMAHPDYILPVEKASEIPAIERVYPLTDGVARKTMHKAVSAAVNRVTALPEWVEPSLLKSRNWPPWDEAVKGAHAPSKPKDLVPEHPARQRLAYDEFLAHQLTLALARLHRQRKPGVSNVGSAVLRGKVLDKLPFDLTHAQQRAGAEIVADIGGTRTHEPFAAR